VVITDKGTYVQFNMILLWNKWWAKKYHETSERERQVCTQKIETNIIQGKNNEKNSEKSSETKINLIGRRRNIKW
jgi:hypothetical protein